MFDTSGKTSCASEANVRHAKAVGRYWAFLSGPVVIDKGQRTKVKDVMARRRATLQKAALETLSSNCSRVPFLGAPAHLSSSLYSY